MLGTNWIERSWNGEERLWKVFWLYNWLLTVAVNIAAQFAVESFGFVGEVTAYTVFILWCAWFATSTWRCAFNVSWTGWAYVARAFVVFWMVATFVSLINADGA